MASDVPDLRNLLEGSFGVDPAVNMEQRLEQTKVIVAWTTTAARVEERSQIEAEQDARHLHKTSPHDLNQGG
jgi:hypothetical protein